MILPEKRSSLPRMRSLNQFLFVTLFTLRGDEKVSAFLLRTLETKSTIQHLLPQDQATFDPIVQLPIWDAQMERMLLAESDENIKNEEGRIAKKTMEELRQKIDQTRILGELGVRSAQVNFYDAFVKSDLDLMKNVWSSSDDSQCIHPGMSCVQGLDAIMESWAEIFRGGNTFPIVPSDTSINICGSTAICRCVENVGETSIECINIYKRENGDWKMTLHMASATIR